MGERSRVYAEWKRTWWNATLLNATQFPQPPQGRRLNGFLSLLSGTQTGETGVNPERNERSHFLQRDVEP